MKERRRKRMRESGFRSGTPGIRQEYQKCDCHIISIED